MYLKNLDFCSLEILYKVLLTSTLSFCDNGNINVHLLSILPEKARGGAEKKMPDKISVEQKELQEKKFDTSQGKRPFTQPKLTFIEPKLTKYGDASKITAGAFGGTFYVGHSNQHN